MDGWGGACSGDVAGRGRKRQADGRPGGLGRTVWADCDGRTVARPDRQADGRPGRMGRTVWADWNGRSAARPDRQAAGRAGGQPCARTAGRADGRAGAAAG
jgi:hypothetical protein